MGGKDKTVSFRIAEDRFDALKDVSADLDPSLSQIFRDFVTVFNDHDGKVNVVPQHEVPNDPSNDGFPATVEVSKSMVREHERLELETEHLREELKEYRAQSTDLKAELEATEAEQADLIILDDLDTVTDFQISSD